MRAHHHGEGARFVTCLGGLEDSSPPEPLFTHAAPRLLQTFEASRMFLAWDEGTPPGDGAHYVTWPGGLEDSHGPEPDWTTTIEYLRSCCSH